MANAGLACGPLVTDSRISSGAAATAPIVPTSSAIVLIVSSLCAYS